MLTVHLAVPWHWRVAIAAIPLDMAQSRVATVADSGQCCLMAINWPELRAAAMEVASRAYAPYSRLRVGAAGLTGDGRVVTGCNVENASYGLTLCAECGLVSALHAMPPPA